MVEFSPMSPKHARACFGLPEELENLFARRVGLVEIGAVLEPYLRGEIEEQQETPSGAQRPSNSELVALLGPVDPVFYRLPSFVVGVDNFEL